MNAKTIKLNKSHKMSIFFFLVVLALSPISGVAKGNYDAPLWLTSECPEKMKFSVQDKMSVYETYNVEYRVGLIESEFIFIAVKTYTSNSAPFDAIYPDDFFYKDQPSRKAWTLCRKGKIFWSIHVNGREISAGIIEHK